MKKGDRAKVKTKGHLIPRSATASHFLKDGDEVTLDEFLLARIAEGDLEVVPCN